MLKRTRADKLILGFAVFFFACAVVLLLVEPEINTYGEALWYCYAVFSTAGFGDIVSVTFVGRILSVVLTILTLLVVALVTGVIVAFYNDMVAMQYKASKAELLGKMEHLEDLTKEELKQISEKIRKLR